MAGDLPISGLATAAALTGTELFVVDQTGQAEDVKVPLSTVATYAPLPTVRTVSTATSSITDADVNNWIDCTVTTVLTVGALTKVGPVFIRNNGTAITVSVAPGANTVECDKPGLQLVTQKRTMSLYPFGSLTHFQLSGAEA